VVCLTGSSEVNRPLVSIKCDAKMVLISVDFPRPVWPIIPTNIPISIFPSPFVKQTRTHTDDDDIELETALEELVLNLAGNAVKTDIGVRANLFSSGHCKGYENERRKVDRELE
jgi:hypothetical protein